MRYFSVFCGASGFVTEACRLNQSAARLLWHGATAAVLCAMVALLCSCGGRKQEDPTFNDVAIAVDETFRPIIEEEMFVFNAKYPEAVLKAKYMPETDAINYMLQDSVRMIIATRPFTQKERDDVMHAYKMPVQQKAFAYDAIALIINRENVDSLISVSEIEKIMTGRLTDWNELQHAKSRGKIEVVFDNANSSTVRFIRDSVCAGAELKGNIKEAKTNKNVIDYVSQTPGAMGIIGVDWLRNKLDSTNLTFDERIRVMCVGYSAVTTEDNCFQPVQYYIATGQYPLTRTLYMITSDPRPRSMGMYFYHFVSDQDGQLIIAKSSQLLPHMQVQVREVNVTR